MIKRYKRKQLLVYFALGIIWAVGLYRKSMGVRPRHLGLARADNNILT